ncbi:MAG TPA: hypothetical protein VE130_13755 [Nitrososphaeraceae archaeon]|nr:hypothetical protein [Nitrososphaeraceae archaeon]
MTKNPLKYLPPAPIILAEQQDGHREEEGDNANNAIPLISQLPEYMAR